MRSLWSVCATVLVLVSGVLLAGGCKKPSAEDAKKEAENTAAASVGGQLKSANDVLAKMAAAYKNATSYDDHGTLQATIQTSKQNSDKKFDFAVAMQRPGKLLAHIYGATICSDGRQWHAFLQGMPGTVVGREAPKQLTIEAILADRILGEALTKEGGGMSPILVLLLADDPLKPLLGDAQTPTLGDPADIDGHACYRVDAKRSEGTVSFWVDQETFVLRRIVMPVEDVRSQLEQSGEKVEKLAVVADFFDARLNGNIDAKAFQFEMPAGTDVVPFFPPFVGSKVPDFKFVDLDGKPVTAKSLAGKVVVLDFWATWCGPCRESMPHLETVYKKYKDNDRCALLAVSVDEAKTTNADVAESLKKIGVSIPPVRDPDECAGKLFMVDAYPTRILVGPDGTVQDCESGVNAKVTTELPEKMEKLLSGGNIAKDALKEYGASIDEAFAGKTADKTTEDVPLPQAKVARHSDPRTFKLTALWKNKDLASPGNVLVVEHKGDDPRLLVLDSWRAVAEVAADGKLLATHKFDLEDKEAVCNLRAATAADGKRYLAGFAPFHQRFHLLNEKWKQLFSFPEDALKNPHKGITDVELADLGEGGLMAYVGYWDVVGVQGVSLAGQRQWSQREGLSNVARVVPGPADAAGHRTLVCVNGSGTLVILDNKGQRLSELSLSDWKLRWIAAADLAGDGNLAWCGLSARSMGEDVAVGFNLKGDALWNYPLPKGAMQQPIEPIVSGRVSHDGPGHWLLPGADGSISFVSAEGKLVDRFNYGASLNGLATAELDGKPTLIVASAGGLEALRIER
jgi:thiol-disulfide isomerase/thioredoxin